MKADDFRKLRISSMPKSMIWHKILLWTSISNEMILKLFLILILPEIKNAFRKGSFKLNFYWNEMEWECIFSYFGFLHKELHIL